MVQIQIPSDIDLQKLVPYRRMSAINLRWRKIEFHLHGGHLSNCRKHHHVSDPDNQVTPNHTGSSSIYEGKQARPVDLVRISNTVRIGKTYINAISQVLIKVQANPRVEIKRKLRYIMSVDYI